MKILHVSTRLIVGGSQENTVLSCEGQSRRGHEVHLAYGPIFGPEGSMLGRVQAFNERCRDGREATRGGHACIPIVTHEVPDLCREVSPRRDSRAYAQLRALLGRLRPDVVHTHSSKAGVLGRWAAWDQRRAPGPARGPGRIVHTIHGPPFMPSEGGPLARARVGLVNAAYAQAERWAARRCDAIVSVADAMTREFLRRGIGRPAQYVTVRSGMETDAFLHAGPGESRDEVRAALGLAPSDFVVGTVARLAQHKGHDDLLEAVRHADRGTSRWRLLWVGDGWWRHRLVASARGMGLASTDVSLDAPRPSGAGDADLLLAGLVQPQRIPAWLRAMDVLAHPSYREGLPRTVPQALLCGVCPVAYDCDGTGEVCREMQTGRLVRTGDVGGLRDALAWCEAHPAERGELAARGRDECAAAYSVEAMLDGLERVYAG